MPSGGFTPTTRAKRYPSARLPLKPTSAQRIHSVQAWTSRQQYLTIALQHSVREMTFIPFACYLRACTPERGSALPYLSRICPSSLTIKRISLASSVGPTTIPRAPPVVTSTGLRVAFLIFYIHSCGHT